jgi:hypothetical protein
MTYFDSVVDYAEVGYEIICRVKTVSLSDSRPPADLVFVSMLHV